MSQSEASSPLSSLRLRNLRISTRIFAGFVIVVALLAGSCIASYLLVGRIETAFLDYKQRNDIESLVVYIRRDFCGC